MPMVMHHWADWRSNAASSNCFQNQLRAIPTSQSSHMPGVAARIAGVRSIVPWIGLVFFGRWIGCAT